MAQSEYGYTELKEALNKADRWVTCAVGNQCSIIPRYSDGQPKDAFLNKWGIDFAKAIDGMKSNWSEKNLEYNRKLAIRTLVKIEKRSEKLIGELAKKGHIFS